MALSEELVKPLKVSVESQHRVRKAVEAGVDKTGRVLAEWRSAQAKAKKHCYLSARDNEKMQDQVFINKPRALTDKETAKLEAKCKKTQEAVRKVKNISIGFLFPRLQICVMLLLLPGRSGVLYLLYEGGTVSTGMGIDDATRRPLLPRPGTGKTGTNERLALKILRLLPRLRAQTMPGRRKTGRTGYHLQCRWRPATCFCPERLGTVLCRAAPPGLLRRAHVQRYEQRAAQRESGTLSPLGSFRPGTRITWQTRSRESRQGVARVTSLWRRGIATGSARKVTPFTQHARLPGNDARQIAQFRQRTGAQPIPQSWPSTIQISRGMCRPATPQNRLIQFPFLFLPFQVHKDKQGMMQSVLKLPHWIDNEDIEIEMNEDGRGTGDGNSGQPDSDFDEFSSQGSDGEVSSHSVITRSVSNGVETRSTTSSTPSSNTVVPSVGKCRALYSYAANMYDELSIQPGDVINIHDKQEDGWWLGELAGTVGIFPATYVEEVWLICNVQKLYFFFFVVVEIIAALYYASSFSLYRDERN